MAIHPIVVEMQENKKAQSHAGSSITILANSPTCHSNVEAKAELRLVEVFGGLDDTKQHL